MDRTPDMLAAYAALADLRRGEGSARNRTNTQPNGLLEMLLDPDFIPPNLRANDEVRRDDPSLYDDLPPLENDAGASTRAAASASDDDMPALEDANDDDGPPPLEAADHLRSESPSPTTNLQRPESSGDLFQQIARDIANLASLRTTSVSMPEVTRRRARPVTSSAPQPEDDAGNESDGSLPSLQTVSDSSDEEDVLVDDSDSDWDDEESLDYSEDETNLVAQMIENAESNQDRTGPTPFNMTESMNIEPEADFDTSELTNNAQLYRELLERAINVIPDFPTRFHPPPPWVSDLTRLAGVDNDPKRAATLLTAMEVVSEDLVQRYERLRTSEGEDVDRCAICRDDLLDESTDTEEVQPMVTTFAALPFHPELDCIVSFPCAGKHLFHRDCLSPWLARKTTCPTCRFDIDPLSLTLQISRGVNDSVAHGLDLEEQPTARVWQHPQAESMIDWLSAEEQAQAVGIPRRRPAVRMPEYPPLPQQTVTGSTSGTTPRRPVRPPGNSFLTDLLRFERGTLDAVESTWTRDMTTDIAQSRGTIDAGLRRATATGVPPHTLPTSPIPASGASPSMVPPNPPSPHHLSGHGLEGLLDDPLRPDSQWDPAPTAASLRRRMLDLVTRQAQLRPPPEGALWHDTPSGSPTDVPPHPADLSQLHNSPLVLSPPPTGFDVNVLNAPLIPEGASSAAPVASPAFIRAPSAATAGPSVSGTGGEDSRVPRAGPDVLNGPLDNFTTVYREIVRGRIDSAELLRVMDRGAGTFSAMLTRHVTLANSSQPSRTPSFSSPASTPSEAPASQRSPAGTDDVSTYNPADDLD